jgi:hypothetical protein
MRKRQSILVLAGAVLLIASATPVGAEEGEGRPPGFAIGMIRDLRLKSLAERTLGADRVLAPLDLSVKVRNGVAEVSGSVPSEEVGRQAIAKLETIRGINEVRANFRYTGSPPTAASLFPPSPERAVTEAAKPVTRLPEDIDPPRTRPGGPAVVTGAEGRKGRPEDPGKLPPMEASPLPGAEKSGGSRRIPESARPSEAAQAPLVDRVERVRQSQPRFRNIAVDVQGETIIVKRLGVRSEDATALSQLLRRLHGVSAVVLSSD